MDYTDAPGNQSGQFTDGDPVNGTPATTVEQRWLNNVQNELVGLQVAAGLTPSKTNETQIREAIARWIGRNNILFNANFVHQNTRLSAVVAVADGETKTIADGWDLTAAGPNITNAQALTNRSFAIEGSGTSGDVFYLKPKLSAADYLNRIELYNTISPAPSNVFTMAARIGTRSDDASASATVDIIKNDTVESVVTVTDIGATQGSVLGGITDSYVLSSYRYELAQKVATATTRVVDVPWIKFTLTSSGSFKFYVNGCGLWNAHITDEFIPSGIMANGLVDIALASTFEAPVYRVDITGLSWSAATSGFKATGLTLDTDYDYIDDTSFFSWTARILAEDTNLNITSYSVKELHFTSESGKIRIREIYVPPLENPTSPVFWGSPVLYFKPVVKF